MRVISWGAAPASDTLLRQMAETFPAAVVAIEANEPVLRLLRLAPLVA